MMLRTSATCVALALASTAAPVLAVPGPGPNRPVVNTPAFSSREDNFGRHAANELAQVQYHAAIRELREEALALQESDGGTITPEHLAYVQERLDTINAGYRRHRRPR